ncbi:hypothetical protein [Nitrosospira sp. NRS527]|uniref:hypothetical protein n=1 Tax=Nitrosospira sp. NRS527 TaxID=155925 RepID=UPI001AF1BC4F|nr:hypothetical protein [Nitrosospira sp. NRS527]BCT67377.1 hypothetical protein NNRS527_00959 [Nitrosospira sp. NRS527]
MHNYFARLAQRSDVAPAVMAPHAPAGFSHADGGALEQHTEVVVTAADTAVTASGPISIVSPPTETKTVASSSLASPELSLGMETEMALSPRAPAQETSARREPPVVATSAARPASTEAHPSVSAPDDAEPALPNRGDDDLAQQVLSIFAAAPAHTEISTARHAAAGAVARPHDAALPLHAQLGEYVDTSSSTTHVTAGRSVQSVARDTDLQSHALPTPRARPLPHTDTQSPQPAVASIHVPLQVHIGRIELEVHQSSPAIAPAQTPVAPPAAPTRRSASFNPRRYYLRGL